MNQSYVLGVDVSKKTLELCLMDSDSRSAIISRSITNQEDSIAKFFKSIPSDSLNSMRVAIEPTGNYWFLMADTSLSYGCRVQSVHTRAAKKFLESCNLRAKTDRLDAKGLAVYASIMELHDYSPKPEYAKILDELLSVRRNLSRTVTDYTLIVDSGRTGSDIAANILAAAKVQLADLDKRIAEAQKNLKPAKDLRTVPGFGPVISAALASKLTSYDFKHSDSFVAYTGLDLKVCDSGQKRGRRVLSKNGDPELRRLLYLAAQSSLRVKDSPFKKIYDSHRERGLSSTASICAVARKLARTAWSIVRFGTEYDPERVFLDKKAKKRQETQVSA